MAPHLLDLPVWALGLGLPERVMAAGGRYILGGDGDAPDTQDMVWQYPRLTLRCDYGMHEVLPQVPELDPADPPPQVTPPGTVHEHEWLQCIREGRQPSCNVEYHFRVDLPITLGNLAWVLGRSLRFDPAGERILDDPEAERRAEPEYRAPWRFPREYLAS